MQVYQQLSIKKKYFNEIFKRCRQELAFKIQINNTRTNRRVRTNTNTARDSGKETKKI